MSATELTAALEASRAKAIAALGRAYRYREDEPDDQLFVAMLAGSGLDDEVAVRWLIESWKIMREYKAEPAGTQRKPF